MKQLSNGLWSNLFLITAVTVLSFAIFWSAAHAGSSTQKGQAIQPGTIRNAVKNYIIRNAPWTSDQMVIKEIRYAHPVQVPSGRVTLRVAAPKHNDWKGSTPFTVQVMVAGERVRRITVPANIEVWSDVIVSVKPLGRHQPIGRSDIRVKRMNLTRVPSNAVLRMDEAIGRRANRNIAADCILRRDQIEMPPIVHRGDIVQVVAQTPALKISVKGMAKQNGGKGERIKVINLRSKKMIYAQVIDDQTVRVDF